VRSLLHAELASGVHKQLASRGQLVDPSAACALVWLVRSLRFQQHLLHGLCVDRRCLFSEMCWFSYRSQLEEYHNALLKATFRVAFRAVPSRDAFLRKVAPGVPEHECYEQMGRLAQLQRTALGSLCASLRSIGVEERAS
jgi:hypothetical protein